MVSSFGGERKVSHSFERGELWLGKKGCLGIEGWQVTSKSEEIHESFLLFERERAEGHSKASQRHLCGDLMYFCMFHPLPRLYIHIEIMDFKDSINENMLCFFKCSLMLHYICFKICECHITLS